MIRKISNQLPFPVILRFFRNLSYPDDFIPTSEIFRVEVSPKSTIFRKDIENGFLFITSIIVSGKIFDLTTLRRVVDNQSITVGVKYNLRSDNLKSSMSDLAGFYITNNLPVPVRIYHKRPGIPIPTPVAQLQSNDGMTYQGASAATIYYTGLSTGVTPFGSGGLNIGDTLIIDCGNGITDRVEFTINDPYIFNLIIGEVSTSCESVSDDVSLYRASNPDYKTGLQYYNRVAGTYLNLPRGMYRV